MEGERKRERERGRNEDLCHSQMSREEEEGESCGEKGEPFEREEEEEEEDNDGSGISDEAATHGGPPPRSCGGVDSLATSLWKSSGRCGHILL